MHCKGAGQCRGESVVEARTEILVLTAARSGEVRKATWDEIDLDGATWTVPAMRMKANREHRVPLSKRALEVLAEAAELSDGSGLVFPGMRPGRPLSENTHAKLLRELGFDAVTHGFRSSFRDWAAIDRRLVGVYPDVVAGAHARGHGAVGDLHDERLGAEHRPVRPNAASPARAEFDRDAVVGAVVFAFAAPRRDAERDVGRIGVGRRCEPPAEGVVARPRREA